LNFDLVDLVANDRVQVASLLMIGAGLQIELVQRFDVTYILALNQKHHVFADIVGMIANAFKCACTPGNSQRAPDDAWVFHHVGILFTLDVLLFLLLEMVNNDADEAVIIINLADLGATLNPFFEFCQPPIKPQNVAAQYQQGGDKPVVYQQTQYHQCAYSGEDRCTFSGPDSTHSGIMP
jgi:hypothetical protein